MSGNNVVYFTTTDTSDFYPTALWVTDGTAGGTKLVESFSAGTSILPLESLFGGFVFATTTLDSTNIYLSLGTPLSTRLVLNAPFGPLPANALSNNIAFLTPTELVGGFSYNAGAAPGTVIVGVEDFTSSVPTALTTIEPQSVLSTETVGNFTAVSGVAFFVDGNANGVSRLYRTDGTPTNTTVLASAPSFANLVAETNGTAGTRLFLSEGTSTVTASSHGELLAMSSTAATPTVIKDFGAGASVASITNAANTLFIVVKNADASFSLWTSDGSNTPPTLIGNLGATAPTQILADGDGSGRIFFQLGTQLFIATAGTTTLLGSFAAIGSAFVGGGTLYFGASDGSHGMQLWSSDGTSANTKQIATINPSGDANPTSFATLGGTLFFSANDGAHGTELWSWNGTAASLVTDLVPGPTGSNVASITPGNAVPAGSALGLVTYGLSNSLGTGFLGVSDGTLGGTAASFTTTPGAITFTLGGAFGAPTLTVSHGSPDTTIALPLLPAASTSATTGGLSYAGNGVYTYVTQTDPITFSETPTLLFVGDNATTISTIGSFAPISGGITNIADLVASGTTEYFLVERADGNDKNAVTQLWSSTGTTAGTQLVATLGTVTDPGGSSFAQSSNAVAGATGWGALLADDTTQAVSLFTSTGTAGSSAQVTLASIGVTGTIDNSGTSSLALAGARYFFSVTSGGAIEAISTGGSAATTAVLTSEALTGTTAAYGDFTTAGNLVYFDDGAGGALYVSGGTSASTHKLLAGGAYLAPYGGSSSQVPTPSTASVTQGGTTYFYFTAMQSGTIGLYYSDGSTVHQVIIDADGVAQTLAQNAYITQSGGNIWFAANSGAGYVTLFATAPASSIASPVIDPALFPTGSLLSGIYGAPEGVGTIQAGIVPAVAADTFFLTPGVDTVAGGAGDTAIYASSGDLSASDVIDGGAGINDLYLTGTGTFDLTAPATLANITQVLASATNAHILLRAGTTITVKLSSSGVTGADLNDTVIGAANADTIIGSGNDTITVGANSETIAGGFARAIITAATDTAMISTTTLEVAGGGSVTLGANITAASVVTLDAPTHLDASYNTFFSTIRGSTGADTITLDNGPTAFAGYYTVAGGGGADTIIINGDGENFADIRDTAANLNGIAVQGFDFAPNTATFGSGSADFIDVTDFQYSSAETAVFSAGTLTITNAAGTAHTSIAVAGAPAGGGFVLASDGGVGTLASFIPQLFTLTTGPDTVQGTATNQIDATEDTLSHGDTINGGAANTFLIVSTLQLIGPGDFDLSLPAAISGLTAIDGDTTTGSAAINQTIRLRDGLDTAVTLGAGHDLLFGAVNGASITSVPESFGTAGYNIFLGDARETVDLAGQGLDVIHVTAATGLASVTDNLQGSFQLTGTEAVDGGGLVPIGGEGNIKTLELTAATHMIELGTVPSLIVGSAGTDTIDITNAGADGFGGIVTVEPNGGGDTVVAPINDQLLLMGTQAQLNNTTIDGFNFLPAQTVEFGLLTGTTIDITDLTFVSGSITTSFTGSTLDVLNGSTTVDVFDLPDPGAGFFTASADGTGTKLTFTSTSVLTTVSATLTAGQTSFVGSPGNDVLTVTSGVLVAGQTLDGQGGDNVIALSGTGNFDLSQPAVLTNFTVLQPGTGETITLRAGAPMLIAGGNGTNTIIGANAPDVISLARGASFDTVVLNNPGATLFDGGFGSVTVSVSAASIGATIDGAIFGKDTLDITGGGGMSMGSNIRDIAIVNLVESGATLFANSIPGLALNLSGNSAAPGGAGDVVAAGVGGDIITDASSGGNILAGGAGNDTFAFQTNGTSGSAFTFPAGDTIYGFDTAGSDVIRVFTPTTTVTYSGGTLHVGGSGASDGIDLKLNGTYAGTFTATADTVFGGTDITFSGTVTGTSTVPCFAAGTRILTSGGEVPVEALRIGDTVPTFCGHRTARVIWLGHRRVDLRHHPRPRAVQPIRIRAGALAPRVPVRDLVLSPDHALWLGDVLVPVHLLVNGSSVARLDVDAVTYWHVELDRHDVVLAEGAPAESYLDTGNRDGFAGRVTALTPDFAPRVREAAGCARLVLAGAEIDAVRVRLAKRAERVRRLRAVG